MFIAVSRNDDTIIDRFRCFRPIREQSTTKRHALEVRAFLTERVQRLQLARTTGGHTDQGNRDRVIVFKMFSLSDVFTLFFFFLLLPRWKMRFTEITIRVSGISRLQPSYHC